MPPLGKAESGLVTSLFGRVPSCCHLGNFYTNDPPLCILPESFPGLVTFRGILTFSLYAGSLYASHHLPLSTSDILVLFQLFMEKLGWKLFISRSRYTTQGSWQSILLVTYRKLLFISMKYVFVFDFANSLNTHICWEKNYKKGLVILFRLWNSHKLSFDLKYHYL